MPLRRRLPGVVIGWGERVGAVGDTFAGGEVVRWLRVRGRLVVGRLICAPASTSC